MLEGGAVDRTRTRTVLAAVACGAVQALTVLMMSLLNASMLLAPIRGRAVHHCIGEGLRLR